MTRVATTLSIGRLLSWQPDAMIGGVHAVPASSDTPTNPATFFKDENLTIKFKIMR